MATPTEEGTGDKLSTRVLKRLNAFTELPVVYELSYVCFWGWQGLIGPVWALLLFAWWFIEGTFFCVESDRLMSTVLCSVASLHPPNHKQT